MVLSPGVPARSQVRGSRAFHNRGYAVVLVSAPGWGLSRGTSDRAGAADIAAADAGIRVALQEPGIDPARVALWGHGRGATTALLASIKHGSLAGVIAVDALLDPASEYATLKGDDQMAFIKIMGRNGAQWNARSPIKRSGEITVPVLLVQTNEAAVKDPAPATEFESRRSDAKLYVEARVDGREAHTIRRHDAERLALDFLSRRTHAAGK
jgi:pimeloyl-ACP methyl ester carboxylesterase